MAVRTLGLHISDAELSAVWRNASFALRRNASFCTAFPCASTFLKHGRWLRQMMIAADKDGDGELDYAEFEAMIKNTADGASDWDLVRKHMGAEDPEMVASVSRTGTTKAPPRTFVDVDVDV